MAEITAGLVKELRDKSGVGMMDCKKALQETGGDIEAATDWLRTKGLSKAAKKADRVAAEGLVAVALRSDGAGMTGAVAAQRHGHEAFGGDAVGLLGGLRKALGAQPIGGGFDVASRFLQRLLAVHHAYAGFVAQFLDQAGGDFRHGSILQSGTPAAPRGRTWCVVTASEDLAYGRRGSS